MTTREKNGPGYCLVIHGGVGTILQENMSAEKEKAYELSLEAALKAGEEILERKGSALQAVEAALRVMEDSPLFNAGKGSVFTHDGTIEMDASIMDGRTGAAELLRRGELNVAAKFTEGVSSPGMRECKQLV